MKELLENNKCWENPPTPLIDEADLKDVDDEDEKTTGQSDLSELLQEVNSPEDADAVASGISNLFSAGIITEKEKDGLVLKHKTAFKKVPSSTIPRFKDTDKHCPFVGIQCHGKDYFINKTTVVWLLQEGEKVSSDRLFRVRSKQPYTSDSLKTVSHPVSSQPSHFEEIAIGDCVFFQDHEMSIWKIGKVLKFSYFSVHGTQRSKK